MLKHLNNQIDFQDIKIVDYGQMIEVFFNEFRQSLIEKYNYIQSISSSFLTDQLLEELNENLQYATNLKDSLDMLKDYIEHFINQSMIYNFNPSINLNIKKSFENLEILNFIQYLNSTDQIKDHLKVINNNYISIQLNYEKIDIDFIHLKIINNHNKLLQSIFEEVTKQNYNINESIKENIINNINKKCSNNKVLIDYLQQQNLRFQSDLNKFVNSEKELFFICLFQELKQFQMQNCIQCRKIKETHLIFCNICSNCIKISDSFHLIADNNFNNVQQSFYKDMNLIYDQIELSKNKEQLYQIIKKYSEFINSESKETINLINQSKIELLENENVLLNIPNSKQQIVKPNSQSDIDCLISTYKSLINQNQENNTFFGFHGTFKANIYSILLDGLKIMNRDSGVKKTGDVMGNGVQLSDNLNQAKSQTYENLPQVNQLANTSIILCFEYPIESRRRSLLQDMSMFQVGRNKWFFKHNQNQVKSQNEVETISKEDLEHLNLPAVVVENLSTLFLRYILVIDSDVEDISVTAECNQYMKRHYLSHVFLDPSVKKEIGKSYGNILQELPNYTAEEVGWVANQFNVDWSAHSLRSINYHINNFKRISTINQYVRLIDMYNKHAILRIQVDPFELISEKELKDDFLEQKMKQAGGERKCLVIDMIFQENFPQCHPFVRIVAPIFEQRSGHVTVAGSVCSEMLSKSGWLPSFTIEAILMHVVTNMAEGGGRLDFTRINKDKIYYLKDSLSNQSRVMKEHGWN